MLAEIFILRLEAMARVAAQEEPQPQHEVPEKKPGETAPPRRLALVSGVARGMLGLFA